MRVFINAGHDRVFDPGAVGHGLKEADVVFNVSKLVAEYLRKAGVKVDAVYQDNSLSEIVRKANDCDSDIFISIHCNSAKTDKARGTETFCCYRGGNSEKLAECIQSQIVNSIGTIDRGVKTENFYVIYRTIMPAVLVELAFINNSADAELLRNRQDEFARAIARGITDYELNKQVNHG